MDGIAWTSSRVAAADVIEATDTIETLLSLELAEDSEEVACSPELPIRP